jgi:3-oxoacyl-[acyl-carrier-protein] synthase II
MVSALGTDADATWQRMLAGQTGIGRLRAFDTTDYKVGIAAEVDNAAFTAAMEAGGLGQSDRTLDFAVFAAQRALAQAGRLVDTAAPAAQPLPVIFGTGIGSQHSLYEANTRFAQQGVRGLRPTSIPRCMANAISARISMQFRLTGANYVVVSACTSASNAIGTAFRMVRDGYCGAALCGGSDATFDPFVYGGWNNLGVLSKRPDPATACRPFDRDRDGTILGEGAGALLLERLDDARARGAPIVGELLGYGESSDATHITRPSPEGQAAAIRAALADAGVVAGDVGLINAHGTATPANDACESQAIRLALGDAANNVPVSACKSYLGHTLGASGAIETILTLRCLQERYAPANLNIDNPDPACDVCLIGREGRAIGAPVAIKNSFGFGGGNAVIVLRRWEG